MFFYYSEEELQRLFRESGFDVIEEWGGLTKIGSRGDTRDKIWKHYLLRKSQKPKSPAGHPIPSQVRVLSDLGERGLLERIQSLLPQDIDEQIFLGVGDDCAAIRTNSNDVIVVTTDPCPQPVVSLLGDKDRWYDGWF